MNPLEALRRNPFVLAPMAGITDDAFRSFMRKLDASVVITELVSATGLEYQSQKTLDLMKISPDQKPVGIQLFGDDPDVVGRAARFAQEQGCDFVDLNFGCPVPKVVKKGAGSAMLKDLPALEKMVTTVKKAIDVPLTIKIRTGWDSTQRNAIDVCKIAADAGVTWVAIHGRTRAQGYSGLADWDYIAEVKAHSPVPVLGNGDILTPRQALDRVRSSGVDGVMIGRGALKNPLIFREALKLWSGEELGFRDREVYVNLIKALHENLSSRCEERIHQIQLRKFAAWFSTGYPGAAAFRKAVFQSQSVDQTLDFALEFFQGLSSYEQEDTSKDGFLMGGHG